MSGIVGLAPLDEKDTVSERKRAARRAAEAAAEQAADRTAAERSKREERQIAERETREAAALDAKARDHRALRAASADVRRLEAERVSARDELRRRAAAIYRGSGDETLVQKAEGSLDRVEAELRRASGAAAYLTTFSA